ncbi:transposase [Pricia sp. S334]|uniref:Transposase n=1 Tax=Pricia mediterranea TaxID=3076079 RepID=A0ABU3L2V9_9FLAO|nr:transposase [Pricia sp. S334]MDT7828080.1 transposase [Pricia sp. S334]
MLITDGKYHNSNVLDVLVPVFGAIYLTDKAYNDFEALSDINLAGAFFVSRAKSNMGYTVIYQNYNINTKTGLRSDKTILLNGHRSKKLYPEPLRLVEYQDIKKEITLYFLTNNHEVSALEIPRLYRNR